MIPHAPNLIQIVSVGAMRELSHITTPFDLIPNHGFKASVIDPVYAGVHVVVGFDVAHRIECAYAWLITFTVAHCVRSHSQGL